MLPLVVAPQPILRERARAIALPIAEAVKRLAGDMFEAMAHYHGIGLAAPQVGERVRLIVIATPRVPTAYLNPEIIKTSWRKTDFEEGCLSIPSVFGIVRRPARVLARYVTLSGEQRQEWLDGLTARVYQHEVDHVNGVLFVDKVVRYTAGVELLAAYGLA